jgi:outer membrane protein assembly factor BamA
MEVMIGSLLTVTSFAQLELKIEPSNNEIQPPVNDIRFRNRFKSRAELQDYLQKLPSLLQAKGYLSASIDSVSENQNITTAFLFLGQQYHWQELRIKEEDLPLLEDLGFNTSNFKIADAATIEQLPLKVISHFESNGYPFAKVKWDSLQITNNNIKASLVIDKGVLYKLDSITVNGSAKISKEFLTHYLGLSDDGLYKRSTLEKIDQRLLELPYLEQFQSWSISMYSTGYVLNFYLRPKRSNQVDALIGFLPSNQQTGGKLLLTVDAKLILRNAFANGELIDFNWQQIQPKSPRLYFIFQQPYIFHSKFGLDIGFQLYKKDSSFLNVSGSIGLQYALRNDQSMKILLSTQRTNLLDVDTISIKQSQRLPDIIDVNLFNLGFEYSLSKTNYRFNPRKGTELTLSATAGKKTIHRNNAISQIKGSTVNFNKLYDSLQLNSYQLRLRLNVAQYFPLAKQAVLKTAMQGGMLQTPNYFRNEMFQVGGYRLLRGFDEESIFANSFAVATLEYRYLLDLNSYFFGFSDIGYTHFKTEQTSFSHTYIGLGAGMAFQTKQGIFNISYALGKRDDLKFDFRQSKIHFGYLSFF